MKINIVTVNSGWILQNIAQRIAMSNSDIFEVSYKPKDNVNANYYVDISNCYKFKTKTLDLGLFTHLHEDSLNYLNPGWLTLDCIIHMCSRYYNRFKDIYPENRMKVIYPGEVNGDFKIKKPVIGIFQRGKFEGKGYFFMKRLTKYAYIMKKFKFLFVGDGWDDIKLLYNSVDIETECHSDKNYNIYEELYNKIDYLLIPSLWEGGPMSLLEAYAMGIPIIGANVGWINHDFEIDYLFDPNNAEQLIDLLNKILIPLETRRKKVKSINYEDYGKKLITMVKKLS